MLMFRVLISRRHLEPYAKTSTKEAHAMKDMTTLHLQVQDLCNCYAQTDPLKEMSLIKKDTDKDEAALKWVALAVLHGVNMGAKEISISKGADGAVKVTAEYREAELPSPGSDIGKRAMEALRAITHIEGKKGELPLALGIRDSNLEVKIKVKQQGDAEIVTLKFGK
jgi:hypothetical protein